jgi:Kef-type K+ transport system membrane component KefB
MEYALFTEISVMLVVAFSIATIARLLKQPLIIAYIISGLLLGPYVFDLIQSPEVLETVSHLGIALLLFIIGLGLNPKEIKEVGRPAVTIGVGQIIFTTVVGFLLAQGLGYVPKTAIYLALAMTLSSTIVILKTISDKKDSDQLYAKISMGFLLVQDIVAAGLLVYVSGISGSQSVALSMTESVVELLAIGSVLAIISHTLLPKLSDFFAGSQEYLFLFATAWGFGVSSIVALTGLSMEIGALLAGVLLSTQMYAQEMSTRLRPLRDFFILFFFITLGAGLDPSLLNDLLLPAVILSVFVMLGGPLIVMSLASYFGYTKRTSFKTAMTSGQVSEFSLIFVLLASESGQIGEGIVGLVTLVALITIAGSTYMMRHDETLLSWLSDWLNVFERKSAKAPEPKQSPDIFLFGYARNGRNFARAFRDANKDFLVVDYDPETTARLENENFPNAYGDVTDLNFLEAIRVDDGDAVVSTISDFKTNLDLTEYIRRNNPDMAVVVYAEYPEKAARLYESGATYVIMPHFLGGEKVMELLSDNDMNKADFQSHRDAHLHDLQNQLS